VALPSDLGDPVKIADSADSGSWVSLELAPEKTPVAKLPAVASRSAAAVVPPVSGTDGKVAGAEVSYAAPLPGVDMAYAATGDAVKESTTLTSLAAVDALPGASITYTIRTAPGLSVQAPEQAGAAIDVVNAKGDLAFSIPPSFMDDAHGEHSNAVTTTVTADPSTGPMRGR